MMRFKPFLSPVALLLSLALSHAALAETSVSGPINGSQTWTLAGSPYRLSGDVEITSAAVVVIQPGVLVLMEANASLTVLEGVLSAQGTTDNPIVITSSLDGTGTPAPGDWGSLAFATNSGGVESTLINVSVRYGLGILVNAASPTLINVSIDHHDAPAIMIDLESSLRGHGVSAQGNTLNGIEVPAGEMLSDVVWGLKGIPYVVTGGILYVGQRKFALSPGRLRMVPGTSAIIELGIPELAPTGGQSVDLVSSVPSVATAPANVIVAEGLSTAEVTINAIEIGSSLLTASSAGYGSSDAVVDVVAAPTIDLAPTEIVVGVGHSVPVDITISDIAPAAGRVITLSSNNPAAATVQTSASITAGGNSTSFNVTTVDFGSSVVTASADGYDSATVYVEVSPPSILLPATLIVAPGGVVSIPVSISEPAPPGGKSITLTTSDESIALVDAVVVIGEGTTSTNASLTGVASGETTLTATAVGYEDATAAVYVDTIDIVLDPSGDRSVPAGLTLTAEVRLSKAAPPGGVFIDLVSNNTALVTLSSPSVVIPEGQTLAAETLQIAGIAEGTAILSASSPGLTTATQTITVTAQAELQFSKAMEIVGKGMITHSSVSPYIYLRTGGTSHRTEEPLEITLTSSDPTKVTVPATVTVPAGQSQVKFQLTGIDVVAAGIVTITASAPGYLPPATPMGVEVVMPELTILGLAGTRSTTGIRDAFYVRLDVPGTSTSYRQTAAMDHVFDLTLVDASPADIVDGFWDALTEGNTITTITISQGGYQTSYNSSYVGHASAQGTYKVGISLSDYGSWVSDVQTVQQPELVFSKTSDIVGKGMVTNLTAAPYIYLRVGGTSTQTTEPLEITLTSSDPTKVTVPATVIVPAGQSQVKFQLTGIDVVAAGIVTITDGFD